MRIDITSLCFGFKIAKGNDSGTPAWATSIAQAPKDICYIQENREGLNNIIYGMLFKAHSDFENLQVRNISGLDKSEEPHGDRERMMFSVFEDVYVNGKKVDGIYTLSFEKEDTASHKNRKHICYAKYLTYKGHSNKSTLKEMAKVLGCDEEGCWFVYDISIEKQSKLHFSAIVVNAKSSMVYTSSKERKSEWDNIMETICPQGNGIFDKALSPYLTALRTKPFLLLAGISGTGKSRIVRELAFKSCPGYLQDKDGTTPGNYCMVEVKPNWHDSTELLGYWSNINKRYMFTKFVKFLVKAKMFPEVPFFVCLDEMNLAPVEQYFAEFLSVLETRRLIKNDKGEDEVVSGVLVDAEYFKAFSAIPNTKNKETDEPALKYKTDKEIYKALYDLTEADLNGINEEAAAKTTLLNKGLTLPENVFIVGTVNMDDTTHQFSRKVIDRAMTIEMNGGALADIFKHGNDLVYSEEPMTMDGMRSRYISASEVLEKCQSVVNSQEISDYIQGNGEEGLPQRLEEINKVLRGTPFTVSYRVMNELAIYLAVLLDKAVEDGVEVTADNFKPYVEEAIDKILLMKILPRVEGDDEMFRISDDERTLNGLNSQVDENGTSHEYTKLDWLREIAPQHTTGGEHKYMAVDKLKEMIGRLNRQSFTRYWP